MSTKSALRAAGRRRSGQMPKPAAAMTTVRMAAGDTQFSRLNPPGSFSPSGLRFCLPPRWRGRCACERDEMMPRKIEEAEPAGACPMADGRAAKAGAGSV